jgi:hypothetical protein
MNKTHRIVWSEARQAYVVAHENAASSGKPSSTRKGVVHAVAAALLALGAGAAAADSCGPGTTLLAVNTTDPCLLAIGEGVTINTGVSLSVSGANVRAIAVEATSVSGDIAAGDILNNGTINSAVSGWAAIRLWPGVSNGLANNSIPKVSVASVTNNGLINAGNEGGIVLDYVFDVDGIRRGPTVTGDIINTGTITTLGADAITGQGVTVGGRVVNSLLLQGGIRLTTAVITSGITNTGTVLAPATAAVNLWAAQVGDVKNTGLIQGTRGVLSGGATARIASISNSGTIRATVDYGLYFGVGAVVPNGLTNTGTIEGSVFGALVEQATVSGGITNGGLIQAASGVTAHALAMYTSTISGGITNSGTIAAQAGANNTGNAIKIVISTISGSIVNSGTIQGANNGVQISTNSVLASLTNSGTISGATAISRDGGGVSAPALVIDGTNTAKFIGAVNTPDSPVTLASGAVYTMQGGEIFTLNGTSSGFAVASNATLGVAAGGTGTITGVYTQDASATFRTHANSTTFGKLLIGGSTTLPATAKFEVVTGNAATCGDITAGTTLAGVISATSLTATSFATVIDDCTNINFTAVKNANAIDLVAVAPGPSTWVVTGASNNTSFGTVSCVSPVTNNAYATCTGTASGGYTLSGASGCGTATISGNTITAGPVTAACTVTGTFAAIPVPVTTQTSIVTTDNSVSAGMSVSGCTAINSAAFAAPTAGAPSNTAFPFGMLGFTLTGCISGPVTVTVTYSQNLPSNATFYKNINGSYAPYSATLGVNTVQFVLQDGIAGDADLSVNGSIRDPGGIGVPSTTESIPTLSEWGVIALTGLMGLFGLRQVRRRKIHS